jgi:hypothetical protein
MPQHLAAHKPQHAPPHCTDVCRAAIEAEEKRKADAAAAIAFRRETKRSTLLPEPAAGSAGAALVRVRLPDGTNAQRSFPAGGWVLGSMWV